MRCIGGRMALFYRYVHLLRCIITKVISVLLVQVILCLSLILPYEAYANSSSSVLTTSYLGRLQNGYYNFQFKLTNASTNLTKTVTKAVSPQSLSKVLRYVVSKRLAAFTTLALLLLLRVLNTRIQKLFTLQSLVLLLIAILVSTQGIVVLSKSLI